MATPASVIQAAPTHEEIYRQLVENMPDGIGIHEGGIWRYANPALLGLFGVASVDELATYSVLHFVAPEFHSTVSARIQSAMQGVASKPIELILCRADGSRFEAEGVATPCIWNSAVATQVAIHDTSARLKAERDLARSEDFIERLVECSPECIKLVDHEFRLLQMNRAGLDMIGADKFSLVEGKVLLPLLDEEFREPFITMHNRILEGSNERMVYSITGFTGRQLWLETNGVPMLNDTGRVFAALYVTRDITERRMAEEERRRAEIQMAQVQRLESIGRLAGGVAHDLNNLLTVIIGCLDMAEATMLDAAATTRHIARAQQAALSSADVVRQLMSFARNRYSSPHPLDLGSLLEEMQPLLTRLAGEQNRIVTACAKRLHTVRADHVQMQQVLMNLVINAREAMETPGTITIRLANRKSGTKLGMAGSMSPGAYVEISVTDTGRGISAKDLPHIFEPFFTTKEHATASGLGLATTYGIVQQHGGAICAESNDDCGSTFHVYLPVCDAIPIHQGQDGRTSLQAAGRAVLVVDDEPDVREYASAALERNGFGVILADSGESALQIVRERASDLCLVLADVRMPGMSGFDLAAQIAQLEPAISVVFISGFAGQMSESERAGPHGSLLHKPFTSAELIACVHEALNPVQEVTTLPTASALSTN